MTGYTGTVRFTFSGNATGKDEDSADHLAITLDRQANSIRVELNQKLTGITGTTQFIGHAKGGQITVQDSSKETGSGQVVSGTQSYSGPLAANAGTALLTIDRRGAPTSCTSVFS